MSPLYIPDGYGNFQLTLTNALGGASSTSSVGFGVQLAGSPSGADLARVANLLRDGLTPRYDNSWLLGPTHLTYRLGGVVYVADDTGTEAGTHASQANCAPGLALVVSKRTGLAGRQFRGRLYMPGVDETKIDEAGVVDGAEVNAWQSSFDALYTALMADAAIDQLVLFHSEGSPYQGDPTALFGFLVRNVIGSMRPRQRR